MVSFDEQVLPTEDLFCAHISILHDECMHEAFQQSDRSEDNSVTIPTPPILAYTLLLRQVDEKSQTYARVGLAEFDQNWMIAGGCGRGLRLV
jgi:hypothetical protein